MWSYHVNTKKLTRILETRTLSTLNASFFVRTDTEKQKWFPLAIFWYSRITTIGLIKYFDSLLYTVCISIGLSVSSMQKFTRIPKWMGYQLYFNCQWSIFTIVSLFIESLKWCFKQFFHFLKTWYYILQASAMTFARKSSLPYCLLMTAVLMALTTPSLSLRFFCSPLTSPKSRINALWMK